MNIDDEKYPSLEELKIDRDEEGEIIPVKGETPLFEKPIIVKPLPSGAFDKYFGDVLDAHDATPENKAEVMSKYYVRPDFSNLTAEDIQQGLDGQTVRDYLEGLIAYSGLFRNDGELIDEVTEEGDSPNNDG